MKRIEAIKKLMTGADDVLIRLEDGTDYYGRELVKLYAYLDAELCESKAEQQKSKVERSAENDDKPVEKKAGPAPRIDTGKLIALAKAGWTKEKIAEELKVSVATVYVHLKKAREEGRI